MRALALVTNALRASRRGQLLLDYARAWEAKDIDSVLDCMAASFDYTDPVLRGYRLHSRSEMRRHLSTVFTMFPVQSWTKDARLFIGVEPNQYAVYYRFSLQDLYGTLRTGTGMELLEFEGDKIKRDEVHLMPWTPWTNHASWKEFGA